MSRGGDPQYWAVHPREARTLMPRTEAGKRLLDEWADDHERVQLEPMVDAIEAEAFAAGDRQGFDAGEVAGLIHERARIRAAVPRCDCPEHGHYEGCCRAAVLRIIDEKAAPAAEGQSTSSGAASTGYEEKP